MENLMSKVCMETFMDISNGFKTHEFEKSNAFLPQIKKNSTLNFPFLTFLDSKVTESNTNA